ncbi:uncharacterized protein LOC111781680 isoform X2 [Cucurbita pepo subsp. pepo]|uniref:uncharacterized protein LOC111781680 isoform X2 n=1 Tax=Cucurbita pepo subsp. pepo TaxID=3664 RepID=UPI000C9D81C8|nr:uncharacterized protein LOC111781680 isoform X2 [Cucurbita pepo subsp. pepo]
MDKYSLNKIDPSVELRSIAPPMSSVTSPPSPFQSPLSFNHKKSAPPPPLLISQSFTLTRTPRTTLCFPLRASSSSSSSNNPVDTLQSASDVVRGFYDGVNRHDLASVEDLIAENCVYEDLIFSRPFVGRKVRICWSSQSLLPLYRLGFLRFSVQLLQDILIFFKKFNDSISKDLQFVIDDISTQDSSAVGVLWHLEWKGKEFPFSKGCSFYRLVVGDAKKRQIIYARDSVEPALKPGEMALIYHKMDPLWFRGCQDLVTS